MGLFTKKPQGTFFGNLLRSIASGGVPQHRIIKTVSEAEQRRSKELRNLNNRSSDIDKIVQSQNFI